MMAEASVWSSAYISEQLKTALLNPIRAFRPRYLPLMMVYFAYGALGLIAVAESFWIKKALTLSPSELAALNVWLTLEIRNEHLVVTIRDDGKGFDINRNADGYEKRGSFGILNMRERAELIDAEFQIESRTTPPNRGTLIQLILPSSAE